MLVFNVEDYNKNTLSILTILTIILIVHAATYKLAQ